MSLPGRLRKVVVISSILAALAALAFMFVPTSGNPADLSEAQTPGAHQASSGPSGAGAAAAPEHSVRLSGPTTVFAAVGDIACSPKNHFFHHGAGKGQWCRQKATAAVARRMHPDGVLMLGDAQYNEGLLREYKKSYKRSWGRLLPKTYPVLGNHDYWGGPPKGFFDFFGTRSAIGLDKGWYSFDVPGWHLIGLNSNCDVINCTPGSAEYTWLNQDLQSSAGTQCQVAFMHHPRWSSGPHGNQEAVWPLLRLLSNAGVDLLLVGHDHIYERFAPQTFRGKRDPHGIREIIVGTGGAQHYPIMHVQKNSVVRNANTFGVLRLSLSKAAYGWKFKPIRGGRFTDSGSASCH